MKPLNIIEEQKKDLYKSFILVAILSVGLALIVNALSNCFKDYNLYIFLGGLLLVLIVVADIIYRFYKRKSFVLQTESILVLDKKGDVIHIPFFRFHNDMEEALNSVFTENKALRKIWDQSFCEESDKEKVENTNKDEKEVSKGKPIIRIVKIDDSEMNRNTKGFPLVNEATEFLFLDWLSKKLEAYFQDDEIKKSLLVLNRKNIPQILLENRIIDIISKPYEEREQFVDVVDENTKEDVYFMNSKNGVFFKKFELILPRKSLMKMKENTLLIQNRNFDIALLTEFSGVNAVLPHLFEKAYLGKDFSNTNVYKISIKLEVNLNPFFFLFWKDWKYLRWIDIIADEFENYFSFDRFVENIGYNQTVTNLVVLKNMRNKKS
jgi:hypothetical protein